MFVIRDRIYAHPVYFNTVPPNFSLASSDLQFTLDYPK